MKLLFIEQHSMKLGDRVFYDIESARQNWLQAWFSVPYAGAALALPILCVYAYRVPLTSKLYKEAFYSLAIGTGVSSLYPLHYRTIYYEKVSNAYANLKAKFEKFPEQAIPDGDNVAKNFGMTKWNDSDVEGEDDLMYMNANDDLFEDYEPNTMKRIGEEVRESIW